MNSKWTEENANDKLKPLVDRLEETFDKGLVKKHKVLFYDDLGDNTFARPISDEDDAIAILNKFLDDDEMDKYAKEWDGLSFSTSREGIVVHEMSHEIMNNLFWQYGSENYNNKEYFILKDFIESSWRDDHLIGELTRSVYANENSSEWAAEAITDYIINGDKSSTTSKKLVELINNITNNTLPYGKKPKKPEPSGFLFDMLNS